LQSIAHKFCYFYLVHWSDVGHGLDFVHNCMTVIGVQPMTSAIKCWWIQAVGRF